MHEWNSKRSAAPALVLTFKAVLMTMDAVVVTVPASRPNLDLST